MNDNNNTLNTAENLGSLTQYKDKTILRNGNIGFNLSPVSNLRDSYDFYQFSLDTSSSVEIKLSTTSNPVKFNIRDRNGNIIKSGKTNNPNGAGSTTLTDHLDPGTYYVEVIESKGLYSFDTYYGLTIKCLDCPITDTIDGGGSGGTTTPTPNVPLIQGDSYNNTLKGNTGNNLIGGWAGNDHLIGGRGNDSLYGDSGQDTLDGGEGDDRLFGHTDNQDVINLLGPDHNRDELYGGAGHDYLDGGNGNDFLGGWTENDHLVGGGGHDALYGDSGQDTLDGGEGNDRLFGHTDNQDVINLLGEDFNRDELYGGAGHDYLDGGNGDDLLRGGPDNDTLIGGDGNDLLDGWSGDDLFWGGNGNDTLFGGSHIREEKGSGRDTLYGQGGSDTLYGDDGDDYLDGGNEDNARDILYGQAGNDLLYGHGGNDELWGGWDNDTLAGHHGNDALYGEGGADTFYGDDGHDYLDGGDGNDYLEGGKNSIFTPIFVAIDNDFTVNDNGWTNFNQFPRQLADVNGDGRADIVGFGYTGVYTYLGQTNGKFGKVKVALDGNLTVADGGWIDFNRFPRHLGDVNGDGRADIVGFASDSVLVSLGQADGTFSNPNIGLDGNYTIFDGGWNNFDQFPRQLADVNGDGRADIVGFAYKGVYVSLGQANGTFSNPNLAFSSNFTMGDGGWTSFDRYPRQLADVNGDGRADIVGFGHSGVYVSLGQANGTFSDLQVALDDNFTVADGGWTSFDRYPRQLADVNGDGRADIVGFGHDAVAVSFGQTDGTFSEVEVGLDDGFTVAEGGWTSFDRYPRQLADVNGDGKADIVGFGHDAVAVSLASPTDDDILHGRNGNDQLHGGNGDDKLYGGADHDRLYGELGNDTLSGDSGDDILVGGQGDDLLTGGLGADIFNFNKPQEGIDTITDFSAIQNDIIQVSGWGFGIDSHQHDKFSFNVATGALFFENTQLASLQAKSGFAIANNLQITPRVSVLY